ncbi:MAG: tripartite tricarboxylate transporter permease [Parvibaculaceae bacterium]
MQDLIAGFGSAFTPNVMLFILFGIVLGYVIGVLPGLNRPVALAVAIPMSYYMDPLAAIAFLIGIAKASGTGGATTAILLNTPGELNAAVTCFDGYPLALAGRAKKALEVALYSSVTGDILGTIALIFLAGPLALVALRIGPVEMASILLLSLGFIAALAGSSLMRGLAAGMLGLFLSTVGLDIETATPRLTFGYVELLDGIPLLAITIGMLGLTEMFIQAEQLHGGLKRTGVGDEQEELRRNIDAATEDGLSGQELRQVTPTIVRSSLIGTAIGMLPGLGPSVASFASYAVAERLAKPGDCFRRGDIKGVAAAETADNAAVPASLIPLFALGLPGSVSAAILLAAFMIHGMTPGPRIFQEHGQFMYAVYASMLIASLIMLVVGRIGLVAFAKLTRVPETIVIPVVMMLCILGTYLESHSIFAVGLMLGFAILGYVMEKLGYSRITFLIGFIIGSLLEAAVRQALVITGGDVTQLIHYPLALILLGAGCVVGVVLLRSRRPPAHAIDIQEPVSGPRSK